MKNKKALLVIIIFLVIILIAFAGVYAYIALDVFKTPKQLFGKYLDNQIMQVQNLNVGALKTVSENLKNNTCSSELDIKFETEEEDVTELKVGLKRDPVSSTSMLTLKVDNNNNELANYSLYADKEKLALKIPELNEKYFSVGIDTLLEEVQKNLKENNITEKDIELSTENIEKYKNELKTLYNKYMEEVKTYFTDDKFTAEKGVQVDVNGVAISANKYTFSMTALEFENMVSDLLAKIVEEPILSDFMTDEQISELKESVEGMKDDIDESDSEDVLRVCIYESSGNTVKIELQLDEDIVAEFMLVKTSDTESNIIINQMSKKSGDTDVGETQTILYTINVENENTTTVTVKTSETYDKDDIKALKKYYEENDYYYYDDEMIDEDYKDTSTSQKMTTTLNGDTATTKITSDAFKDLGYKSTKMQINYSFGSQVSFDNINDAINLEDYIDDEEKQNKLMQECMENLQNSPNSLIGMLFALNSYSDYSFGETDIEDFNEDNDYITINNTDKEKIEILVKDALNDCLDSYKRDLEEDENINISDYLTVNKISEMMLSSLVSDIELLNGSTLKLNYNDELYYISLVISAETLEVEEAKVYTESEYQEL